MGFGGFRRGSLIQGTFPSKAGQPTCAGSSKPKLHCKVARQLDHKSLRDVHKALRIARIFLPSGSSDIRSRLHFRLSAPLYLMPSLCNYPPYLARSPQYTPSLSSPPLSLFRVLLASALHYSLNPERNLGGSGSGTSHCCAIPPHTSSSEVFAEMDTNGDGVLELHEVAQGNTQNSIGEVEGV